MTELNKPNTRNKGQRRPPKERRSPPPVPAKHTKRKSATPPAVEEPSPTKQKANPLIPTSHEKQDGLFPASEFQDVAESGVLAASLKQSIEKLKVGCIFEKYWTKPIRKKTVGDASNPDIKSMQKLGVCSMSIEPHVFEVTLFTVRSTSVTFLPPVGQANIPKPTIYPGYHYSPLAPAKPNSYTEGAGPILPTIPPNQALMKQEYPTRRESPNLVDNQRQPSQAATQHHMDGSLGANPRSCDIPTSSIRGVGSSSTTSRPRPPSNEQGIMQQSLPPQSPQGGGSPAQPPSQMPESVSSTNPVIQMLAQRASADSNLKSLMKIVANGNASESQLKTFQRHIDELNSIIKGTSPPAAQTSGTSAGQSFTPMVNPIQTWSMPPLAPSKQEPLSQYYSQQPQYSKSKPPGLPKPDISAIVFDITGGNGDRYLIPKKSILEYLSGSPQVLVSFLVTRKGGEADQGSYKAQADYYQHVTIKLSCSNYKVLEPLAKIVEPQDTVRRYMEDVMAKANRAEDIYLITQLPRDATENQQELKKANESVVQDSPHAAGYQPPNSLLPLRQSKVKFGS